MDLLAVGIASDYNLIHKQVLGLKEGLRVTGMREGWMINDPSVVRPGKFPRTGDRQCYTQE